MEGLKTEPAGGECRGHCWHMTDQLLLTDPPQTVEVCCWCGAARRKTVDPYGDQRGAGHGQWQP